MKRSALWIACATLAGLISLSSAHSQSESRPPDSEVAEMRVYSPKEIKWQKGPASLPGISPLPPSGM